MKKLKTQKISIRKITERRQAVSQWSAYVKDYYVDGGIFYIYSSLCLVNKLPSQYKNHYCNISNGNNGIDIFSKISVKD